MNPVAVDACWDVLGADDAGEQLVLPWWDADPTARSSLPQPPQWPGDWNQDPHRV